MHHGHIRTEHLEVAVLSVRKGERPSCTRDEVNLQLWTKGLTASLNLSPDDARALAVKLVGAADAAEAREPELIDFCLYREPEAA